MGDDHLCLPDECLICRWRETADLDPVPIEERGVFLIENWERCS